MSCLTRKAISTAPGATEFQIISFLPFQPFSLLASAAQLHIVEPNASFWLHTRRLR